LSASILIYSETNPRAVLAFCRYAKQIGLSFHIVANGDEDSIFQTIYVNEVLSTRSKDTLELEDLLKTANQIRSLDGTSEVLVLPSTEYLNRFLVRNQAELEKNCIITGLCKEKIYNLISDKHTFSAHCQASGITIPKEYTTIPLSFPFVVKPKVYAQDLNSVNEKPILVGNEKDMAQVRKLKHIDNYYFQEYVDGASFYLLYHFFKNGEYTIFSQENLIQQDNGASIVLAKSSGIHRESIGKKFADIFVKMGFSGLVMVEVKKFKGNYYMIEANPRFWGPSQLILDAGMSLFDDFLLDQGIIHKKNSFTYLQGVYYYWSGGLIQDQSDAKIPRFYNFSKEKFFEEFHELSIKDIYLREDAIKIYVDECSKAGFSKTIRTKQ